MALTKLEAIKLKLLTDRFGILDSPEEALQAALECEVILKVLSPNDFSTRRRYRDEVEGLMDIACLMEKQK